MRFFTLLSIAILPIIGSTQTDKSVRVSASKKFVYVVETSSKYITTKAYQAGSVYYNKRYERINECWLTDDLHSYKTLIVKIIKKEFDSIALKIKKENRRILISFLPKYDGTIADVWFLWESSDFFLTEDEMERLATAIKKLRISFDGKGIYDTPYCQILSLGILPKDL